MLHMMRLLTLRNAAYPAYGPLILRKFYGSILLQYITIILLLPLPIELAKLCEVKEKLNLKLSSINKHCLWSFIWSIYSYSLTQHVPGKKRCFGGWCYHFKAYYDVQPIF